MSMLNSEKSLESLCSNGVPKRNKDLESLSSMWLNISNRLCEPLKGKEYKSKQELHKS